jgi:hypothetical protein
MYRLVCYESLDKSHTSNDHGDFVGLTAKLVEEMLDFYLNLIGQS